LDEAVELASYFLPKDVVVAQGDYRVYKDDVFLSYGYDGLQGIPLVVMVDSYTASAGEIIALALRDHL
jgi:C-terminal processing protease CtpA/Prc